MSSLLVLIPLGLLFVGIAVGFLVYASNSKQFKDLDKAARSILDDD